MQHAFLFLGRCLVAVSAFVAVPAWSQAPVAIHLAGDSTMAPKLSVKRPETGWGERLQAFFDPNQVRVRNHARNGRSTRTFVTEGRWRALLGELRPGDYVFIQFGHNDQSGNKPDRYTPLEDYRKNLARFATEVRARHAQPVLLTPVARRYFDEQGVLQDSHGAYPEVMRAVAAELDVPLIDMQRRSETILRDYGPVRSKALYLWAAPGESPNYPDGVQDNTHFSPRGAQIMAAEVVQAVTELGLPLAQRLAPEAVGR